MPAALFPGQGVQAPGMDEGLADADVFAFASDALGTDVAELCRTGTTPEASLSSTRWAQPAVLVCSVASFDRLVRTGHRFTTVAGHSVGEYAALVAAGALTFADALTLISSRAEITARIAESSDGAMAALLRIGIEDAVALCSQTGVALAADNAPGQCVISGEAARIEDAIGRASETRTMARRLEVSGAFHSHLMEPAVAPLAEVLAQMEIRPPRLGFWSSTTATRLDDPEAIRTALLDQLTSAVRWRETVAGIAAFGEDAFVDVGPGKVVGALARRIATEAEIRYAADLLPAAAS